MRKEIIPDNDLVYRRMCKDWYNPKKNKFTDTAFLVRINKNEKYLSVNWSKYISAENASFDRNTKRKFGVGALKAEIPRSESLEVIHKPYFRNPSYSGIIGEKLLDEQSAYEVAGVLADKCVPIIVI